MSEITAKLNDYRQSPRKVRLVADALRGKNVKEAKIKLGFITKRATGPLHKLLDSAVANGKNLGANVETLWVKSITVDGGRILKRRRPVSHGSAHPINKRTSHIKIVLEEKDKQQTNNAKVKSNNNSDKN
jgi:large subunit ribosomal protein L22